MTITIRASINPEYFEALSDALTAFQMIEESLKSTITTCYKHIEVKVKDEFRFGYSRVDVENLPLGKLLEIYRRLTDNTELITELQALPKDRNHIAHRAFVDGVFHAHEAPEQLEGETKRIKDVAQNAN